MNRELLFSINKSDFDWDYIKGSGAGGQKKNKTSSAVRCRHRDSGAVGYSEASRSQHDNKKTAFEKCVATKEFRTWHRMEVSRRTGQVEKLERKVEEEMRKIRVECKDENGRWVEYNNPKDRTVK